MQQRTKVLIVEGESQVAHLENNLQALGYDVIALAHTGAEALRLTGELRPDIVLIDVDLAGEVDGIAAARQIRERWQIPVVFLTGTATEATLRRASSAGPYAYLVALSRIEELNATIHLALLQHQAEIELFAEHQWIRTLLDSLSDGVIAADANGQVRYLNSVAQEWTGWHLAEAVGRPIEEVYAVLTLSGEPVQLCHLRKVLAGTEVGKERFRLCSRQGTILPVEEMATAIRVGERTIGAVGIFADIKERLRQEKVTDDKQERLEERVFRGSEALGNTRTELRALSAHLLTVRDEEQRKLARELHDNFGQQIAILEMYATQALEANRDGQDSAGLLRRMRDQITRLDTEIRDLSHRLHSSVVDDLGIGPALRALIEDFREAGLNVSLRLPEPLPLLPIEISTGLFRIAQEALRNASKHAPDAPILITLGVAGEMVQMTIRDAGPGFEVGKARANGGLGLLSMQERARLMGGNLLLRSRPNEGTTITVHVARSSTPPQTHSKASSAGAQE